MTLPCRRQKTCLPGRVKNNVAYADAVCGYKETLLIICYFLNVLLRIAFAFKDIRKLVFTAKFQTFTEIDFDNEFAALDYTTTTTASDSITSTTTTTAANATSTAPNTV